MGLSINTMTLGGIAVAIGELVDDAIVDVENIFRRLRENRQSNHPQPALDVVLLASTEIRSSIVYGTAIVVLVFLPLLAIDGMEGKLFVPLAIAYVVSLLSSLVVSLTVTPALSSILLVGRTGWRIAAPILSIAIAMRLVLWVTPKFGIAIPRGWQLWTALIFVTMAVWAAVATFDSRSQNKHAGDGWLLNGLKRIADAAIATSVAVPSIVLGIAAAAVIIAGLMLATLDRDFLPAFNEGSVQVNVLLEPGTSLATSNRIGDTVQRKLLEIESVRTSVRRTGRAELDEHAEGVNTSEIVLEIDDENRERVIGQIRDVMDQMPGVISSTEQPLAHLISHMVSGVKARIGIKVFGDDLDVLRRVAEQIKRRIEPIDGLRDVLVEAQTNIPQLRIEVDRPALLRYGLRPADVMETIQTAMNGSDVGQILTDGRTFDLVGRLDDRYREDQQKLKRLAIRIPSGGDVPLEELANIYESMGPHTIRREQIRRRIVIQANVAERGIVEAVADIRAELADIELPPGYFIEYGGQFESQQSATTKLALLSGVALVGMFLDLYTLLGNISFPIQVMVALPTAFVGAVIALVVTNQNLTIAAIVGFISLCGIASRNGILLLNHYKHLVENEGEQFDVTMIRRAGRERLAPVLMTALTSGIGLLPLAMAAGQP